MRRWMICLLAMTIWVGCQAKDQTGESEKQGAENPVAATPDTAGSAATHADASADVATPETVMESGSLVISQSRFDVVDGQLRPRPATMVLLSPGADGWTEELVEDPDSNVFHKSKPWRGGLLNLGAMGARLVHFTRGDAGWSPKVLWEKSWGGKFDRLRDLEIGDVDNDGVDELVLGTHDQGVVAVGNETDAQWSFVEMDETPDTFVHEVEIGDVDGDGKQEFYVSVSGRNRSNLVSQSGGVYRYDYDGERYVRSEVVAWAETHAKEILVADLDGDGVDELYVAREAETRKQESSDRPMIVEPVQIIEMARAHNAWKEVSRIAIEDQQLRFLVAADLDGDGTTELAAAAMTTGLWRIQRSKQGLTKTLIDADSGGFEHATTVGDIDGDGAMEIYVAADKQREIRRYQWDGSEFKREVIATTPARAISWNLAVMTGNVAHAQIEPATRVGSVAGDGADPTGEAAVPEQTAEALEALGYFEAAPTDNPETTGASSLADGTWPGLNLYTSRDRVSALLVDMEGEVVHRWDAKGSRVDGAWMHIEPYPNGDILIITKDRALTKRNWESEVVWRAMIPSHHDVAIHEDGRIFTLTRKRARYNAIGEDFLVLADRITILSADGEELETVPLMPLLGDKVSHRRFERLKQRLASYTPERLTTAENTGDVLHTNSIEFLHTEIPGIAPAGSVVLSCREASLVAILDADLQKVLWSWGPGELDGQHDVTQLANGNLLMFDNGYYRAKNSRVIEVDPVTKEIVWSTELDLFSQRRSGAQMLPNGNILITESDRGRALEINRDSEVLWEYWNPDIRAKKEGDSPQRGVIYRFNRLPTDYFEPLASP